jgi:hypothetical protein
MAKKSTTENKNSKKTDDKKGKVTADGDEKQSKVGLYLTHSQSLT